MINNCSFKVLNGLHYLATVDIDDDDDDGLLNFHTMNFEIENIHF